MEYSHKSVLLAEVTQQLRCSNGQTIVDCTLGGAGHSEKILDLIAPDGFLLGIDQDIAAIDAATVRVARFSQHFAFIRGSFADLDNILEDAGVEEVDGFILDLGLSSFQVDTPERGFSYQVDAALDMRFNADQALTAEVVLNTYREREIAAVLRDYGEERWAGRIAAFIVKARERERITTTAELVGIIKDAIPAGARRRGPHPARRTFQALRMEVNQEITALERVLEAMPKWLSSHGRIVVISYHSLEDRLVKRTFKQLATGCTCPPDLPVCVCEKKPTLRIVTSKPIVPSAEEISFNPRSRSAKLRVAEKAN